MSNLIRKVMWSNFAQRDRLPNLKLALLLLLLALTTTLSAQVLEHDSVMAEIHKRITSTEKLTYHDPLVFAGEISSLGPVPQSICKSAVSQEVIFTISRLLFGNHPDPEVRAGYINCTRSPLPSPPFTLHAKVIVYCEQRHSVQCLAPVVYTDADLRKVQSWIAKVNTPGTNARPALIEIE